MGKSISSSTHSHTHPLPSLYKSIFNNKWKTECRRKKYLVKYLYNKNIEKKRILLLFVYKFKKTNCLPFLQKQKKKPTKQKLLCIIYNKNAKHFSKLQ